MRDAFSESLVRLARADRNVLLLTGDHGYALFDAFRNACSAQYINAGIAEQNMVGMAAGLARQGFRPFVYGLSAFVPVRVLEQIKLDVAHDGLPVVLVGDGAGFVYSHLGTSHQSSEDIACARSIPNLSVYSPADRHEMTLCMDSAYRSKSAVYLRIGKSDRGDVHPGPVDAKPGQLINVRRGSPGALSLVATGSMLRTAVEVADGFEPSTVAVWSAPFIKPLNEDLLASLCSSSRGIVVLEEHSILGGLGGAVSEIAAERAPTRLLRIGVRDRFSEHCGSYDYLLREHGLDLPAVREAVRRFDASIPVTRSTQRRD